MFKGRHLVIATKHKKEFVIGPLLEKALGVHCFVPKDFDTDKLGTFSGETERKDNPLVTARKKCLEAMDYTSCDLGVASEGSFGPHPNIPFASADDEFLIFIDKKNNLEIIARELSLETNFNGQAIKNYQELLAFSERVKFPSHALILRPQKNTKTHIIKDIRTFEALSEGYKTLMDIYQSVYAETDMRAMHNPSRMSVIEKTTKKLVQLIASKCPQCKTPGFGITDSKKGLPCELCNMATTSTLSLIYSCKNCNYQKEELHPNGKAFENPMYCNYCNP